MKKLRIPSASIARAYLAWLRPQWRSLLLAMLLAISVASLDLVWPLLLKRLIDCISDNRTAWSTLYHRLNWLCVVVVAILLGKQCLDTIGSYQSTLLIGRFSIRLRRRLFERILQLPLGVIGEFKAGGVVGRLGGDIDTVANLTQTALIAPAVAVLRIICTLIIVTVLSWRLAMASLIALPIMLIGCSLWLGRVRPIYRQLRDKASEIDARVAETISGIRVVRAFAREQRERLQYIGHQHQLFRDGLRAARIQLSMQAIFGLLMPAVSIALVWYGGLQVHLGHATIGDIFAFQLYAGLVLPPVFQIIQSIGATQRGIVCAERIEQTLQTRGDVYDTPGALPAPQRIESIRFADLNFQYPKGTLAVENFNLSVRGGSTVALVGASGAGKTTLTDLLARFHDPTSGQILINDRHLRNIQLRSYRSQLAIVQQETFLFGGSIRENIAYSRSGVSDSEIEDAARRANADEFIRRLPDGYATQVGERGVKLSGGQKQRLSIARAILADPQILILDEATSSLDSESEQLVHLSLMKLFQNRTVFVIAHRLSTIMHADQIVVMQAGRIAERGTHSELMRTGTLYPQMIQRQQCGFLAA